MTDYIKDLQRLAGLKEGAESTFEIQVFNVGNSRPFISSGDLSYAANEVIEAFQSDDVDRVVIKKAH